MKPSELSDDVAGSDREVYAAWGEDGELHEVVDPDTAAATPPARLCQVCGKPGVRYNARVHAGACRRERRRCTQKELRRRRRRR